MYAGVDIGGTKTLVAALNTEGVITEQERFPTPDNYEAFVEKLANTVANMSTKDFGAAGVGIPGKINREHGIGLDFGHLNWHHVPIQTDCEKIFHCPTVLENDANLAGLSEAMLVPQYQKVLYVTVSTGIGTGVIDNRTIEPALADSEGGHILLEHHGKLVTWESFASGHALVEKYGKQAEELGEHDAAWNHIARNLSRGILELVAVIQPDVIIFGGSVGRYFERFQGPLHKYLKQYEMPLVTIPPLREAARPEEAVIYGCYDLAKARYGSR
ncbi:MAG TPA: ROK family protein [Candidatus Saccharimonadales bacterium]|nr:ROK family protein [Candidatus Saccharimonadales bacterium]